MRDALLLLILCGGALVALRRPWVGAMMWTWVSLMSPHVEFGWKVASYPIGMMMALATLVGLLFSRERQNPFLGPAMWMIAALVLWITITLPFSMHFDESLPLWERSMKIFLMLFVTVALLDDRRKLDCFIWVCALSVGFYGFKGGLFTLATGGHFRVWGPGGFIQGNNELAVALTMTVPMIRYLQLQMAPGWRRHLMTLWMILCMVSIVGTHSRGALLAIVAMSFLLWTKSDRKALWGVLLIATFALVLPMMPDHWWDRMRTIQTYEEDASAMGRIFAWKMAFNLANDRLFGGGFMVAKADVFAMYAPGPGLSLAAHSIYFQMMGEHGWIGLILFVGVGWAGWRTANRTIEQTRGREDLQWAADLSRMGQVGLVGFAAGGAFLSLAYFDGPYNLVASLAVAQALVSRQVALADGRQGRPRVPAAARSGHRRPPAWADGGRP